MRGLAVFLGIMALTVGARAAAEAPGRRVALVIAESAYPGRNFLTNPPHDAALVASALGRAGFDSVIVKPDLGKSAFADVLRDFHQKARGAEAAVIYYSGHGIQSKGQNWLIPVDAAMSEENDLNLEAVGLDQVLAAADGAKWKIVALDACRDTPFAHEWVSRSHAYQPGGLASVEADNVVVMYATAPNEEASDGPSGTDSPFASAFAAAITAPGLEIHHFGSRVRDQVQATNPRQRPFYTDSISEGVFYFTAPITVNVTQPATAPAFDPRAMELALWNSVSASNDAGQLNAYLSQYPNGAFASAAKAKIASLQRSAPPPATVDPRALELAFWNSISSSSDPEQYRAYLDQYPNGQFASLARLRLGGPHPASASAAAPAPGGDLRSRAERGDAAAQVSLGFAYERGQGQVRDLAEAARWYRKAADQGYANGESNLGVMYRDGLGVPQDYGEAVTWFRKSAEQGYASGEIDLGYAYESGHGVAQSYAEAVRWYRKAADQGSANGEKYLGVMYRDGLGVARDYEQAAAWFRKAADQGLADAEVELGFAYEKGRGVPQDNAEAVRWYRLAADQGSAIGQKSLGVMYRDGLGVAQDYGQAVALFRKAADQNLPEAENSLGFAYERGQGLPKNYAEAVKWYRKAAERGYANGQSNLGVMYRDGMGVTQDYAEALNWFRKSADQGFSDGEADLGYAYEKGQGVAPNAAEAANWYHKAADHGSDYAKGWLARNP